MKRPSTERTREHCAAMETITILAEGDDESLRNILGQLGLNLQVVRTFQEAVAALSGTQIELVISEYCLGDGHCWTDLLDELSSAGSPPPLVVADRLADAGLWADVLNLGGYDLLRKPFEVQEVLHVVNAAWRSHNRKPVCDYAAGLPKTLATRGKSIANGTLH